jgi:hypothetical protein
MAKRLICTGLAVVALLLLIAPEGTEALPTKTCGECWQGERDVWCQALQCYVLVEDDLCMPDAGWFADSMCRIEVYPVDCGLWDRWCTEFLEPTCLPFGWS